MARAAREMTVPDDVVERNIALAEELMRYLLDKPHLFESLPDDFELVILPDDDPDLRAYNMELISSYGRSDKPIVFARIKSSQDRISDETSPSLYVPVAA